MLHVLDGAFLPFVLCGLAGWGIFVFGSPRKPMFWSVLFLVLCGMILWRSRIPNFSSRYSCNLILFFTLGCGYFLQAWPDLFAFFKNRRKWIYPVRMILIAIVFLILILKFFHYNPYRNYVPESIALIAADSVSSGGVVVTIGNQYSFRNTGLPEYSLPDFLQNGVDKKAMVKRAIDQFSCRFDRLYIVVSDSPDTVVIFEDKDGKLEHLKCFRKNRKGKSYLHIYRYINSKPFVYSLKEQSDTTAEGNVVVNGTFEAYFQRTVSGYNYYTNIENSSKKGVIPPNALFPQEWDILWAGAFGENSGAQIYLTENMTLNGRYSLFMGGRSPIGILHHRILPSGDYKFRCLVKASQPSEFTLRLSLRDSQGVYQGMRDLKTIELPQNADVHILEADIPAETFRPYPQFYLYLILEKGEVCLDDIGLLVNQKRIK